MPNVGGSTREKTGRRGKFTSQQTPIPRDNKTRQHSSWTLSSEGLPVQVLESCLSAYPSLDPAH